MARKRGFILRELMLYLVFGSLLLGISLKLFQTVWFSFRSIQRQQEVTLDFLFVSERLKYDLYKDVQKIEIGRTSFTFSFLDDTAVQAAPALREYTFCLRNGRLVYNIYNGTTITANYLSSLVQSISLEAEANLLTVIFDYGDHQFRRTYRLDHIKTQRISDGWDPDSAPVVVHRLGRAQSDRSRSPNRNQHRLCRPAISGSQGTDRAARTPDQHRSEIPNL